MKRALTAGTVYFLILFALGFVLGTLRVTVVVPCLGAFAATMAEVPVMLVAAYFTCRWMIRHWNVPPTLSIRLTMMAWFLLLLFLFETLLGTMLFGRTLNTQVAALVTPAGMLGLSAQMIAAFLPVFIGRDETRSW
jgi:hypothetical protein